MNKIKVLYILFLIFFLTTFSWAKINTIVIDAGHGGRDPGAIEKKLGLFEKNVNLSIAKYLNQIIKQKTPWIKVVLTRNKDFYIDLNSRVKKCNKFSKKNTIFISIHTNSHNRLYKVKGIEVFYYSGNLNKIETYRKTEIKETHTPDFSLSLQNPLSELINDKIKSDSKILAIQVAKGLKLASNEPIRRVKSSSFFVVSYQMVPSILVEVGFITSKKFLSRFYQKKIAKGILVGILSFIKKENKL